MPIRTLYIGLGGTGAKSILRTKKCFVDAYGEVPPMVGFLAIDTDHAIKQLEFKSRKGDVVKFDSNEICLCGIKGSAVTIVNYYPTQYQWLPSRNKRFLNNLQGPVRSNGCFLAKYNATYIQNLIITKFDQIANEDMVLQDDIVENYTIHVNIVGSAAGGTGSGMFLDIMVLAAKILRKRKCRFSITPWILLPDVFRQMAPGIPSAHCFANAYGLLKELDYLYHLSHNNQQPIDFLFDQVYHLDDSIEGAYLINNVNEHREPLLHVYELTELIGRCMFLPALLPSNEFWTIRDAMRLLRNSGIYTIGNKEAHYASVGFAEIVYDNQAIGNVIARGIIGKICNELCQCNTKEIFNVVNAWTRSDAVAIQEHEADLLIDSILTKYAPINVIIDKKSDANVVNAYIQAGALAENVKNEATGKANEKYSEVKAQLLRQIQQIINSQNGIGQAKAFLESLLDNISNCQKEMNSEAEKLQQILAYPINWDTEISSLRISYGPFKRFDRDAADVLQGKIADHIAQHRDLLRHNLAIQFFTVLSGYANELLNNINVFKINIEAVEQRQRNEIALIQLLAQSTSHFEIYLHTNEVCNSTTLPDVSETYALLRHQVNIYDLIHKTQDELNDLLFNFAKKHQKVIEAVNVTIGQKIASMPIEEVKEVFSRAKVMSTPLWKTQTHGYDAHCQEMESMFFIGVYAQSVCPILTELFNEFVSGYTKPIFISTWQTDRITFIQNQYYCPLDAVNNVQAYKKEAEHRSSHDHYPVYYLDEQWHQRMTDESRSD